jgi:hypothetical protein
MLNSILIYFNYKIPSTITHMYVLASITRWLLNTLQHLWYASH